jgi:molybdate transport system permease protein
MGPGGWIASLGGGRSLAFTFEGLVIGSVFYSMPFIVQPIRTAFEAFGERPPGPPFSTVFRPGYCP